MRASFLYSISSRMKSTVARMSNTLGCSGTTALVAILSTPFSSLPSRPAGVSSTTCVTPLGTLTLPGVAVSQGTILPAEDGRSASHWREDCCLSTSPSMTRAPREAK